MWQCRSSRRVALGSFGSLQNQAGKAIQPGWNGWASEMPPVNKLRVEGSCSSQAMPQASFCASDVGTQEKDVSGEMCRANVAVHKHVPSSPVP